MTIVDSLTRASRPKQTTFWVGLIRNMFAALVIFSLTLSFRFGLPKSTGFAVTVIQPTLSVIILLALGQARFSITKALAIGLSMAGIWFIVDIGNSVFGVLVAGGAVILSSLSMLLLSKIPSEIRSRDLVSQLLLLLGALGVLWVLVFPVDTFVFSGWALLSAVFLFAGQLSLRKLFATYPPNLAVYLTLLTPLLSFFSEALLGSAINVSQLLVVLVLALSGFLANLERTV